MPAASGAARVSVEHVRQPSRLLRLRRPGLVGAAVAGARTRPSPSASRSTNEDCSTIPKRSAELAGHVLELREVVDLVREVLRWPRRCRASPTPITVSCAAVVGRQRAPPAGSGRGRSDTTAPRTTEAPWATGQRRRPRRRRRSARCWPEVEQLGDRRVGRALLAVFDLACWAGTPRWDRRFRGRGPGVRVLRTSTDPHARPAERCSDDRHGGERVAAHGRPALRRSAFSRRDGSLTWTSYDGADGVGPGGGA